MANLAQRNLVRALRLGVPSGQSVARAMGIRPLSDADLGLGTRGAPDFDGDSPLWFYILREAELLAGSQHLGPVGGRIVAEVLIGLLIGDQLSWLNIEPDWQPPLAQNGRFGVPELIRYAEGDQTASGSPQSTSTPLDRWRATFGPGQDTSRGKASRSWALSAAGSVKTDHSRLDKDPKTPQTQGGVLYK
jgi:hypothetical protein